MRIEISGPATLLALVLIGCGDRSTAETGNAAAAPQPAGCLAGDAGYLKASLRGAINADLDWHGTEMSCDGSTRPDGHGLRITIAGPLVSNGVTRSLRFVFGIEANGPDGPDRALATNLTAIIEGEKTIYSTRGDDKCTTDSLRREIPDPTQPRQRRIDASGFCTGPASSLDGAARLLVSRFDFATTYTTEDRP